MEPLPSLELLEKHHAFPCVFTFKAIGKADDDFAARVIAAVRQELNAAADPPNSVRRTEGGRHIAVTLEPHIETAAQALAVYRCLQQVSGLILLL